MLLDNPAVTDGHLETTENRHPCAEFLVKVKQDSALAHIHQRINFNKPDQGERDRLSSSANSSPRYPQQTSPKQRAKARSSLLKTSHAQRRLDTYCFREAPVTHPLNSSK